MSIYMELLSTISPITGESVLAEARAGGNGDIYGTPEGDVGNNEQDLVTDRLEWDSDLSDGFDSGGIPVEFHARAGGGSGGVTWYIQAPDGDEMTYGGVTYGSITEVDLVMAVQASQMQMTWSNVSVQFYKGGALTETIAPSGPLDANTLESGTVQQLNCIITPTNNDNDEVVITAVLRMRCTEAYVQPDANEIFSQVLVFADDTQLV